MLNVFKFKTNTIDVSPKKKDKNTIFALLKLDTQN